MKFLKGLLRHPIMLTLVICLIGLEIYLAFIQTNTVRNERRIAHQTKPAAASTQAVPAVTTPPASATHASTVTASAATAAPAATVKPAPAVTASKPAAASTQAAPAVTTPPASATHAAPVTAPATTAPAATVKPAPAVTASKATTNPRALLEQARKSFWSHDYKTAEAKYRALIKQQPNQPEFYGELGNVLYDSGNRHAAGEQYAKAAELYLQQGKVPAALGLLPIISELAPKQAETLRHALSERQAKPSAPMVHEPMHESKSRQAVGHEASLALLIQARRAYWQRNYGESESDYRKLIAETPEIPMLHGELGNVLYASGKREAAGKEYARAAELYLQQGNVRAALGLLPIISKLAPKQAEALRHALAERQGKPLAPRQEDHIRKPPTQAQLELLILARQAYWHKDFQQAVIDYHKLIKQTPDIPRLHGELGNVLLAEGKPKAAAQEYLKAGDLLIAQGRLKTAARLLPALQHLDPAAATALMDQLKNGGSPKANAR